MSIEWTELETAEQLQTLQKESETRPVIIYKHSTRCATSLVVLNRLERSGQPWSEVRMYFLDLLRFRALSSMIENVFSVRHESPQLLVIRNRAAVLNLSHFEIEPEMISRSLSKNRTQPFV
jgi:bacillithiol system protein YtxJ